MLPCLQEGATGGSSPKAQDDGSPNRTIDLTAKRRVLIESRLKNPLIL